MSASVIISRSRSASPEHHRLEDALARLCVANASATVVITPDLYDIPDESAAWSELAKLPEPLVVASWLYPRPAEWLLRSHGLVSASIHAFNLAAYVTAEECFESMLAASRTRTGKATGPVQMRELEVDASHRWYPVVDHDRCGDCRQCVQFCLFGVYELDDQGHVIVRNPDNCKDGCPACSRICPNGAIMFPRHAHEAIAGAPGQFMSPDEVSRHMFYRRTGKQCPVCGAAGPVQPAAEGDRRCEECGRRLRPAPGRDGRGGQAMRDEIDALIDSLDGLSRGDE